MQGLSNYLTNYYLTNYMQHYKQLSSKHCVPMCIQWVAMNKYIKQKIIGIQWVL